MLPLYLDVLLTPPRPARQTNMKRLLPTLAAVALILPAPANSQQEESYDYWRFNRDMIQHGMQAILTCNGLFTSNRTLEQVFE